MNICSFIRVRTVEGTGTARLDKIGFEYISLINIGSIVVFNIELFQLNRLAVRD